MNLVVIIFHLFVELWAIYLPLRSYSNKEPAIVSSKTVYKFAIHVEGDISFIMDCIIA